MLHNPKHVFWEALVIALFVFGLGVLLGVFIENGRANEAAEIYLSSETNLLDIKAQSEILSLEDVNCKAAVESTINFGDQVFRDAEKLERYENANRITSSIIQQHRRYDTLRTMLWINTLKIKEKCGNEFNTLIYLYDYQPENLGVKSEQAVFSNFLGVLKEEYGSQIILIPIAKNMGISSLNLLIEEYGINSTTIILDEKYVFDDISELDKIKGFLD